MSEDPDTLRLYARIFEKPRRYDRGDILSPPGEIERAAAKALRLMADAIERTARPDTYDDDWKKDDWPHAG